MSRGQLPDPTPGNRETGNDRDVQQFAWPGRDRPTLATARSAAFGVLFHLAALLLIVRSSLSLDPTALPAPTPYQVRLLAPPAIAVRLGNPTAAPDPEDIARTPGTAPRSNERLAVRPEMLAMLEAVEVPGTFGAEEGLPDGAWDGFAFGRAGGVLGGIPGGVPGGQIGGLPDDRAEPRLPAPDEPPVAIAMPRPRFPAAALREGIRGRVVLRALITERGAVEVIRVLRSTPGLDAEAVRVVESEWRFRPAQRNGRPVAALSDLVVTFSLR